MKANSADTSYEVGLEGNNAEVYTPASGEPAVKWTSSVAPFEIIFDKDNPCGPSGASTSNSNAYDSSKTQPFIAQCKLKKTGKKGHHKFDITFFPPQSGQKPPVSILSHCEGCFLNILSDN
jgi:hypothetical protein